MLQTLVYLAAAVGAVLLITWVVPPGTSVVPVVILVGALFLALTTAPHGPAAVASVLDAVARLTRAMRSGR